MLVETPGECMSTKHKSGKRKKGSSALLLFAKTFFIASCVFASVVFGGAFVLRNYIVVPPPIPPTVARSALTQESAEDPATSIQYELNAPEGFTTEDRRELFYTFLIVGLDDNMITDAIIVASFDGVSNTASAVSIPRDTKVNVNRNVRKINVAHSAGRIFGDTPDSGIRQLKRELRDIIGFMPDFYMEVELDAFTRIVDAVGGVMIDVPFHMSYDDPFQRLHIDIPAGYQLLDGKQAVNFARFRNANTGFRAINDYQRMENQQALMMALARGLLTPASILRIPELVTVLEENVRTNLRLQDMLWFASRLSQISGVEALSVYTLPIARNSGAPNWYEFVNIPAALELVNDTINPFVLPITTNDVNIAQ